MGNISQPELRSKEGGYAKKAFSIPFLGTLLTLSLIGMVAAGWFASKGINLALVTVCMLLFLGILGIHHNGRVFGILISERNTMSLSRFQTVLWTVIVLSAYLAISLERIRSGVPDPLAVAIDWRLWTLMGMSLTSLVGSPLILSNKRLKEPVSEQDIEKTAKLCGKSLEDVKANATGILYANAAPEDAEFTDMFEGDEVGDTCYIDISKVQMFFFTVIAAISYEVLLFHTLQTTDPKDIISFPVLSEGFLAILGISHAGYLTSKSINSTKSQ